MNIAVCWAPYKYCDLMLPQTGGILPNIKLPPKDSFSNSGNDDYRGFINVLDPFTEIGLRKISFPVYSGGQIAVLYTGFPPKYVQGYVMGCFNVAVLLVHCGFIRFTHQQFQYYFNDYRAPFTNMD